MSDTAREFVPCCEQTYYCPTVGEYECPVHGGFDVCCDNPALHRPRLTESRGVQTQLTEERWLAEVSAAKDRPTRDELLLRDIWGALGLLGHLVNETEQNEEVDRLERVIAEILQVAERRILALADAYLALLEAAQAAEEMLNAAEMEATHGVTASPAFVDRQVIFARDRLRAAVSVGSPETSGK